MPIPTWRKQVDPTLKHHLELLIRESAKQRKAYKKSPNPANAQLWCALADLFKQISNINLKLKVLEKAIKNIKPKTRKRKTTEKALKKY